MTKTGEILRKAREAKGLSLNEVALSLKISSKILKAIEDGNSAQLPAKTFLRGFVQSYAIFLRLDAESIMATFYEEMGSTKPKALVRTNPSEVDPSIINAEETERSVNATSGEDSSVPEKSPGKSSSKATKPYDPLAPINQTSNTKTVVIAIVGAILIGLILFTKKMIDKYSKEAQVENVEVTQPIEVPPPEAPTLTDSATPEKSNEPAPVSTPLATAPATNMSVVTPAASPSPVPTATPKPTPSPTPVASPKPSPTPAPSPSPTPTPKPSPSPSPIPVATPKATPTPAASPVTAAVASPTPTPSPTPEAKPANKPVELIIEALDNVDIEYSSNAGQKTVLKLNAEQVHTFKSKNGLKLSISNGGAVNLILNGRDLGIPGDLGKPIKLSY